MLVPSGPSRRKVLIAAPTYKRNDLLDGLLKSLNDLLIPDDLHVEFAIIDNDAEGGARPVVERWQSTICFPLHYLIEQAPGVTQVRNRALELAADFDLLAFIDDDEFASPEWLSALMARYDASGAAAVFGPVISVYPDSAPGWMREWGVHGVKILDDEDRTTPSGAGNCLIDMKVIRDLGLRFDERMSLTGGEDTLFFAQVLDAGYRLSQAKDARIYEHVPESRVSTGWLMRRWYRIGLTDAMIAGRNKSRAAARLAGLANGVVRVGAGSVLVALATILTLGRNPRKILARCYTVCRGAGMISFAIGNVYEEYGRSR